MIGWWRRLDSSGRTAAGTVAMVCVMFSLGWAAIPLYDWFCRVTGFGGTTQVGVAPSDVILDRTVTVRFDANVDRALGWEFEPVERLMTVRIGETGLAFYEVHNPTDQPLAGTASFNVTPYAAGVHFIKIACFCFELQVLQPGERMQMPVTFYVDPELVDDPEAQHIHTITLSYTFHPSELPETATSAAVTN